MLGSAPAATPLSIVFICFVVLLKPQFVLLKIIDEGGRVTEFDVNLFLMKQLQYLTLNLFLLDNAVLN